MTPEHERQGSDFAASEL